MRLISLALLRFSLALLRSWAVAGGKAAISCVRRVARSCRPCEVAVRSIPTVGSVCVVHWAMGSVR